jgi:hypothetical protein
MTTSANVSEYEIYNEKGERVGYYRQHWMCYTHWEELLKYQPLKDHSIRETWLDEEEEYFEDDEPENLEIFLKKLERQSKELREYFNQLEK